MEDIESLWILQERVDELKQKLQYMTYELEITKKEAKEQMRTNNEQINKLFELLQTTCMERDEAKAHLKNLKQFVSFNNNSTFDHLFILAPFTEFNNTSIETSNNNNNINSSSRNSLSSDDCNSNFGLKGNTLVKKPTMTTKVSVDDQGDLVIKKLAKGRPLPPKGKLLQAVIDAGPLLQTLLVAGSVPRWRNPPRSLTHHMTQNPQVNIKGCYGVSLVNGLGANLSSVYHGQAPGRSRPGS